ncbi:MAG TPA: hypothetical protein VMS60_10055 [Solirubrobacterales bacterium]|nr:hypothetical protein [Solirubrobacterales bacterium]
MYDHKGQRKMDREEYARSHAIRVRILALYEQDERRSLSLNELLRELSDVGAQAPVVAYHCRVLSDIGLLPRAGA